MPGCMSEQHPDIEAAIQAGIDISLIDASLRLTYEERALQHQSALQLMLEFERAGKARQDAARPEAASTTAP